MTYLSSLALKIIMDYFRLARKVLRVVCYCFSPKQLPPESILLCVVSSQRSQASGIHEILAENSARLLLMPSKTYTTKALLPPVSVVLCGRPPLGSWSVEERTLKDLLLFLGI